MPKRIKPSPARISHARRKAEGGSAQRPTAAHEEFWRVRAQLRAAQEEMRFNCKQLRERSAELARFTNNLDNRIRGVDLPILILEADLRIRKFSHLAAHMFHLISSDVGRPLTDVAWEADIPDLGALVRQVSEHQQCVDRDVQARDGRWYRLRIRPCEGSRSNGPVLLALGTISTVRRSLEWVRQEREFAEAFASTVREPLLVLDTEFRVVRASRAFYDMFRVFPRATEGQILFQLGAGEWNVPDLRGMLENVLSGNSRLGNVELELEFPPAGFRTMSINARPVLAARGSASMILLAIDDITERQRSEAALARARDEERRLLAREVHDDLVQRLARVAIDLGACAADTKKSEENRQQQLRSLQSRVIEAAEVGRRLAHELHPTELEDLGLESALRGYCESLSEEWGIRVEFTCRNLPAEFKRETASCIYRVAQESLRNIAKHAEAQRARVVLEAAGELLRLRVADSGAGFPLSSSYTASGIGIASMRERVRLSGGIFVIQSAPGRGTQILVEIPLEQ